MNETKVYVDGFSQTFAGEDDFLSFLKSRKDKTTWKTEASSNLRFEALVKDTARTEAIVEDYRDMGKEDVIEDTLDGTQLVLRAGRECIPVGQALSMSRKMVNVYRNRSLKHLKKLLEEMREDD